MQGDRLFALERGVDDRITVANSARPAEVAVDGRGGEVDGEAATGAEPRDMAKGPGSGGGERAIMSPPQGTCRSGARGISGGSTRGGR